MASRSPTPLLFESPRNSVDGQSSTTSCATPSSGLLEVPLKWRDDTMECIKKKKLTPRARKEIVQTLVTLLITKVGSNPSRSQCENVARCLILKYPFMRDDIGTGYASYTLLHVMYFISVLLTALGILGGKNAGT